MGYTIHMEEQVALITGAGQGIGAAIAKKLSEAGAQIVINDVCEESVAKEVMEQCAAFGKKPHFIRCDISDENQVKEMIAQIIELYGRLDILVNNAGIVADWDKSYAVNTKAM